MMKGFPFLFDQLLIANYCLICLAVQISSISVISGKVLLLLLFLILVLILVLVLPFS